MSFQRYLLIAKSFKLFVFLFLLAQLLEFLMSFMFLHLYSGNHGVDSLYSSMPWITWFLQFIAHGVLLGFWWLPVEEGIDDPAWAIARYNPYFAWMSIIGAIGVNQCFAGLRELHLDVMSYPELLGLDIVAVVGLLVILWYQAAKAGAAELKVSALGPLAVFTLGLIQVCLGYFYTQVLILSGLAFIALALFRTMKVLDSAAELLSQRARCEEEYFGSHAAEEVHL